MICPHCENEIERVFITAPALVETIAEVSAEVTFEEWRRDIRHDKKGTAYLSQFRLEDVLRTIEPHEDHRTLEIDDQDAVFSCPECDEPLERELVQAEVEHDSRNSENQV